MHVAKKYQFCVCLVSMVFISIYCSTPPANDGKIVIASIAPIADIAHNISGNVLKIITVIPPNANPHTYEITPSDAKLLKSAAIFVGIHPNFDGWISKMIPPSAKLIYLSELIKGNNPHVWLSVKNTTRIAAAIRDFFSSLYPQHAHLFEKNYTAYRQKLDVLDNRIHNILSSVPHKKLIQWHPAWDYFARDYGLTIAGTIESGHGDAHSIKKIAELKKRAIQENIKVVIIDYYAQNNVATAFVREINGVAVRLDGIGDPNDPLRANYLSLMEFNAKKLSEALSQ